MSYFNGLGLPAQDIAVRASGDGARDIVMLHAQDCLLRETRGWLPWPVAVTGSHGAGAFVDGAASSQDAWYRSRYSISGSARVYAETAFEESEGGRPLWSRRPGADYWSADKKTVFGHGANTAEDAVPRLDVGSGSGYIYVNGTYPAGTLLKSSVTDEDGAVTETFTDLEGHTVMERRLAASGAELARTLFAYDDFGRLAWAVQPEGAAVMQTGHTYYRYPSASDAASRTVRSNAFIYFYDDEDNVAEKNLAGTRNLELSYGDGGLLESVLDGNLASDSRQVVYSYDGLGRLVKETLSDGSPGIAIREYAFDVYPASMPTELGFEDVDGITTSGGSSLLEENVMGMLAYEKIAELDADGPTGRFAQRAHYYDALGNCIQTVTLFPDGRLLRESSRHDLRGNVVASCASMGEDINEAVLSVSNSYDARGRITVSSASLNGSEVSYVEYGYDQLGRPCSTLYGNGVSESIEYDLQGREYFREVYNSYYESIFSSLLRYNTAFNGSSVPSWSGNISSWTWTQYGQDERTYGFAYDGLRRLTSTAQYRGSAAENLYGEDCAYDRNGNVTSLSRRNGSATPELFSFQYSGNRRSAWSYDSNGNVTCENPDGEYPVTVDYNILNLPARIMQEGEVTARTLYLADGTKTAVMDFDGSNGTIYCGPFRCNPSSGNAVMVAVPGGLAVEEDGGGYAMHYVNSDHLGSTRIVTDGDGEILEQFDYLPYGSLCQNPALAVANQDKTPYLYGGKELPQIFGIGWYDNTARYLNTVGAFSSPDPLAELTPGWSPYAYAAGNPVSAVDPLGLTTYKIAGEDEEEIDDGYFDEVEVSRSEFRSLQRRFRYSDSSYLKLRQRLMDKYGYTTEEGDYVLPAAYSGATVSVSDPILMFASVALLDLSVPDPTDLIPAKSLFEGAAVTAYAAFNTQALIDKRDREIAALKNKAPGPMGVQYALIATKDGWYTSYTYGGGLVRLKAGDVWKYGETTQGDKRYSKVWENNMNLRKIDQASGTQREMKIEEKKKIYSYFLENGHLPPGNKIFR